MTGQLRTLDLAPRDNNTWRPPWGWTPDPHPAAEASTRTTFLPAFAAHPSYLPLRGPAPAAMDTPMFPEYYHMVDGRERVHDEVSNSNVRRTVEQFHSMSAMRVTAPRNFPYMAFEPTPTEQDMQVQEPGLTLDNIHASRIPDTIAAIHHTSHTLKSLHRK